MDAYKVVITAIALLAFYFIGKVIGYYQCKRTFEDRINALIDALEDSEMNESEESK